MLGACEFDLRDSPEAFKGKTRGCGGGGGRGFRGVRTCFDWWTTKLNKKDISLYIGPTGVNVCRVLVLTTHMSILYV